MQLKTRTRVLSLLLLVALVIGIIPAVFAANDSAAESVETAEAEKPQILPPVQPSPMEIVTGEEDSSNQETEDPEDQESDDGQSLTRDEDLLASSGISLYSARSATGTMGKQLCVSYSNYESPTWHCHRYEVDGTHKYGHYFYSYEMAYHSIDGELAYCIEPNTTSLGGETYSSYDADSASSSSFWMLELDATQRDYITKILACGYPEVDYGYTKQQQYAATQVLIWEVCCKTRYANGIR